VEDGLLLCLLAPKSELFLPLAFLKLCCGMERVVGIFYAETAVPLSIRGSNGRAVGLFLARAEAKRARKGMDGAN
jgi:hypothetical protein